MVDLASLAGFDHKRRLQAAAGADEIVVHGSQAEQRRDRDAVGAQRTVGQDNEVGATVECGVGLGADPVERLGEPRLPGRERPGHVDRGRRQRGMLGASHALELGVGQDRLVEHELHRVLGAV